jgi:hypothetical protein
MVMFFQLKLHLTVMISWEGSVKVLVGIKRSSEVVPEDRGRRVELQAVTLRQKGVL